MKRTKFVALCMVTVLALSVPSVVDAATHGGSSGHFHSYTKLVKIKSAPLLHKKHKAVMQCSCGDKETVTKSCTLKEYDIIIFGKNSHRHLYTCTQCGDGYGTFCDGNPSYCK